MFRKTIKNQKKQIKLTRQKKSKCINKTLIQITTEVKSTQKEIKIKLINMLTKSKIKVAINKKHLKLN